jgi:hypothetical protein
MGFRRERDFEELARRKFAGESGESSGIDDVVPRLKEPFSAN